MNKSRYIPLAVAAAIAAAGIGTAFAQTPATKTGQAEQSDAMEVAALEAAKVSLTDAIAIAEKEVGGKAIDAGFEDENGTYAYEVEILGAKGEQTVLVDADSGKVTNVAQNDDDGDQDEGDEGAEDEGSEDGEDND